LLAIHPTNDQTRHACRLHVIEGFAFDREEHDVFFSGPLLPGLAHPANRDPPAVTAGQAAVHSVSQAPRDGPSLRRMFRCCATEPTNDSNHSETALSPLEDTQ